MKMSRRRVLDRGGQTIIVIVMQLLFVADFVLLGVPVRGTERIRDETSEDASEKRGAIAKVNSAE